MRFEDMDKLQSTPIKVDVPSVQTAEILETPYRLEPELERAPMVVADSRPFAETEPALCSLSQE